MEFFHYNTFPDHLESDWNELLNQSITHVPFLRFGFLKTWWQTRGGGEWPQTAQLSIVTAEKEGKLTGIAPFFLNQDHQKSTLYLLGSKEICDYLDIIVRPSESDQFMEELLNYLTSNAAPDWNELIFFNLMDNTPTLQSLAQNCQSRGWAFQTECTKQSPLVTLPGDWETYLSSLDKKQRHEIRRKMRRASESSEVSWHIVNDQDVLETEMDDFLNLMALDEQKAHFLTPSMREQMRECMRWAFREHCLQLSFFDINGQKAAAYFCFDYLNRIWVYNSGYDPRYSEYSPGWVLLSHLLQWAIEQGREAFDFMRGNEDYKYRFGAKDRMVLCAMVKR
jgi:CelD/BcsL family acetyltransferase involved in cellulose biosynthesis